MIPNLAKQANPDPIDIDDDVIDEGPNETQQ